MGDELIHANAHVYERTDRRTDMTKFLGAFGEFSKVPEHKACPGIRRSLCLVNKSPAAHYLLRHSIDWYL
jgi:hypothetical protein